MRPIRGVSFCGPRVRTSNARAAVLGASLRLGHLITESLARISGRTS